MIETFPFPIPEIDAVPYWAACNREELSMQHCVGCGRFRWTPSPLCDECGSANFQWKCLSGRGSVYTWTVVVHPVHPAAIDLVPYVVAEIALEEQDGLHLITNLIGTNPEEIQFGMEVEVVFSRHPDGQRLPQFRPRSSANSSREA